MLVNSLCLDVSLDYVKVENIVDRKVDQLSHQYLCHVKLKGETDLVWLNSYNFVEPVKYNKRRSQDSLPRKTQFAQLPEKEIKRTRKVEVGIYYSYKGQEKNWSILYKVTTLDQMLHSWLKNIVYIRSLECCRFSRR